MMPSSRDILRKNFDVVIVALLFVAIGFYFGTRPETVLAIKSDLAKRDMAAYRNVGGTTIDIFVNNALIAGMSTILVLYSLYAAVLQVGIAYGAIWAVDGPLGFLLVMTTFGFLEFLGSFLGIFGGVFIIKRMAEYVLFKIFGRKMSEQNGLRTVLTVLVIAVVVLFPAAVIEALLLYATLYNAFLLPFVVGGGALTTVVLYYYILFKKGVE